MAMNASSPKITNSSKLLLHEEPLQVLPALAVTLGLNEAIILQQLHYWLRRKSHVRDNREWHYNTYADWQKQFPFWSVSTIKRTMVSLEKSGVVIAGNFNNSPIDKTKWYAIDYNKLNELCDSATAQIEPSTDHIEPTTAQIDTLHGSNCPHQYQETNTETTDRENPSPLYPPKTENTHRPRRGGAGRQMPDDTRQVLDHLNTRTQRHYRTAQFINSRLREGYTVADCVLVIDWWAESKIVHDPTQDHYFDNDTPFRPGKFDKYLAAAQGWEQQGRQGALRERVSEREYRSIQASQRFMEEDHGNSAQRVVRGSHAEIIDHVQYRID